jgi:hypothetical protein
VAEGQPVKNHKTLSEKLTKAKKGWRHGSSGRALSKLEALSFKKPGRSLGRLVRLVTKYVTLGN